MKNLGTNEWTILNNIIYKIYTTEHFDRCVLFYWKNYEC